MSTTSPIDALSSPPATAPMANGSKEPNKPFEIRAELLASTRLAPKTQLLYHTRSLSIQVIAHEVFLLILACTKCFAAANREPPLIGILGGGNVGTTVLMTLLANGYRADRMALSTRQPDRIPRCEALKAPSALPMFQLVPRYYDNARLARESDILILCMPPSQLKSVTIQIRHALAANADAPPLVVSALCGVTHHTLSKACGSQAVVRVQPDVVKIASQWRDQHKENGEEEEETVCVPRSRVQVSTSLSQNLSEYQQGVADRDQQPLSLRLAAEAIAPQREDVRNLVEAFCLLCRRAWGDEMSPAVLGHVLFGDKSAMVLADLEREPLDSKKQHVENTNVPLVVSSWPLEWEHDLTDLQKQLAVHTLQHSK
ncbi:NADP oxidoreductase coenzyme F420-dependent [Phytophthora infestans]|uniref:NADP oxidoreductase coenzyme F420-dependent n=1 Tax=Phytophthora infestans TaxID=4787 RepID=A0A833RM55_PHYIN|nr:NADP oxidoreductase coenzyme F420-dependent [Phytophthora infestans]